MSTLQFYWKSTCTTCRKARSFLVNAGVDLHERDLAKKPFTRSEIEELVADRDINQFINPKSTPYKSLQLNNQNLSRDQWIDMLAKEVNLFKRPFIIKGDQLIFGFSESEYQTLL